MVFHKLPIPHFSVVLPYESGTERGSAAWSIQIQIKTLTDRDFFYFLFIFFDKGGRRNPVGADGDE